jgi:hypothetical protein
LRQLPFGLTALIASVAATASLVLFGCVGGAAPSNLNIFRTPIPYALLFLCWFVVTPARLPAAEAVGSAEPPPIPALRGGSFAVSVPLA